MEVRPQSNRAAAAETPGAAVLDVCQLSLLPDDLDAKEIIGVYGEVRFLNPTTLIISNYRHPHYATEVDIRKMDRGESARLATDCARSGCPQIVTGAFIQGRLHATRSYPYKNDFGMSFFSNTMNC